MRSAKIIVVLSKQSISWSTGVCLPVGRRKGRRRRAHRRSLDRLHRACMSDLFTRWLLSLTSHLWHSVVPLHIFFSNSATVLDSLGPLLNVESLDEV